MQSVEGLEVSFALLVSALLGLAGAIAGIAVAWVVTTVSPGMTMTAAQTFSLAAFGFALNFLISQAVAPKS